MARSQRTRPLIAVGAAAGMAATMLGAVPAQAADGGPVAEYVFDATSGTAVDNLAGGDIGSAVVENLRPDDWTGTSLALRGGPKDGDGTWVRLPEGILSGATSATVTAEVRASEAALGGYHFLWSVGNESPDTEYLFASLNCASGRAPLVGIKAGGAESLVQADGCDVASDRWVSVTSVIDGEAGTASLYLDGELAATGAVPHVPGDVVDQSANAIARAPWPDPLFEGQISAFRVYDRAIDGEAIAGMSDADARLNADANQRVADEILAELDLSDVTTDTHIDLPTAGGAVTWSSSDPDLVAPDGTVAARSPEQGAATAVLAAEVSHRGMVASQQIRVTVEPGDTTPEEQAEARAARYVIDPVLASGATLPAAPDGVDVAVESVDGEGVRLDGTEIVSDADAPVAAEIAVTVTDVATGTAVPLTFAVTVLPESGSVDLLAYHRSPTSEQEANNADVALSAHLALGQGEGWAPLNENYGIFFAKTSETPGERGTTSGIIRSLVDPHIFHEPDGGFGIVATRVARGGGADGTERSSLLYARSDDLLAYEEIGLVDLGVTSGVNDPAAMYDTARDRYVVSWTSDAGIAMITTFGDLADPTTRGPLERGDAPALGGVADAPGVDDYASGAAVAVPTDVADALEVRFGRIANTSAEHPAPVELVRGEALDPAALPGEIALGYDDGSTGSLAVDWDTSAVDVDSPGTYEVAGAIRQPEYPAPFADERADPSIYPFDWNGERIFLMIATEDLHMNPIDPAVPGGPHMPIRVGATIDELSDEAIAAGRNEEIDLLNAGDVDAHGGVMTGCFWAPEFHLIDGRLSILFMPCYDGASGSPDMWTGRASIMQLEQDADGNDLDPRDPANWSTPQHVMRADGETDLNALDGISLDMTHFEDSGTHYYAWQMLGSVFIAEMDPSDPTRITTDPTRIIVPEYAWDNVIAEGANVLERDGTLYMIYSGSSVGDTYTTGLVTAPAGVGADLADPATWSKLNYPLQKSGPYEGDWQLGTGHGMWSQDEDGNDLYVFHARTDHHGLTGRDTFVRRVHWASDGLPVFDMERAEELADEFRNPVIEVVVRPDAGENAPPGHGGTPPGHGGTPPGHEKRSDRAPVPFA